MFNTLLNMWIHHKLTKAQIENAVAKKWITQEQANIILSTPQE